MVFVMNVCGAIVKNVIFQTAFAPWINIMINLIAWIKKHEGKEPIPQYIYYFIFVLLGVDLGLWISTLK